MYLMFLVGFNDQHNSLSIAILLLGALCIGMSALCSSLHSCAEIPCLFPGLELAH